MIRGASSDIREVYKTKQHPRFREWLATNQVWVRLTTLLLSNHVKMGWLLRSHPNYTNFNKATTDLGRRIGVAVEIEILPHTISHRFSDQRSIKTSALKVVITSKDSEAALNRLIRALKVNPSEFKNLTMRDFKLIPFQDNVIGREGLTELTTRQNGVLHSTVEILLVDGGWCDGVSKPEKFDMEVAEGVIRETTRNLR